MVDWQWKIGILHGYGEAIWQEMAGKIKHVTRIVPTPNGDVMFAKALICVIGTDRNPQFDVDKLVVCSQDLQESLAQGATRVWEGGVIVTPPNGRIRP